MTYCVAMRLDEGLVFMSDTRTNAGVDNFSKTKKMFTWEVPGERVITLMTAGNLATTQSLVSLIEERSKAPAERSPTILHEPSMFQVARLVGATLKEVIEESASTGQVFEVPEDKSVLDVLEANGFEVPSMCTEGLCGTCLVDVLDGTPDHRDFVLDDDEKEANNIMTVCCSRSLSPKLKLDL